MALPKISPRGMLLVVALLGFMVHHSSAEQPKLMTDEHRLMEYLMTDYLKAVRPVNKTTDKVDVQLGIALLHIDDLDESKGALYLNTWLRMLWTDIRLQWVPADYGGVTKIHLSVENLWQPDIVLYNSFSDFSTTFHRTLAIVNSDGSIIWIPPVYMASSCPVDLSNFPYDTQVCQLKFGSWTYSGKQVKLMHYGPSDSVDTSAMAEHHEFNLVKTNSSLNSKYYDCCPDDEYQDITYTLHLKRVPHSVNHMIVAPSVLLNLVLPIIFVLPPELNEKINYGVGLLIANTLVLMLLVNLIPFGHPTIPAISHYHMANIILTCLALAVAALIKNIWAKGQRGNQMPNFVKTYMLGICGRLMCVSRDDYMPVGGSQPEHSMRKLEVMTDDVGEGGNREDDREQILRNFARSAQSAEWKQLAVILDRLSFVVFFTMSVIITIAMTTR